MSIAPVQKMATYEELADEDDNMLLRAAWPRYKQEFWDYLAESRETVQRIVAAHLSCHPEACTVAPVHQWKAGSYNVCMPVTVAGRGRVMVRCPLDYRFKSTADEKIRGEAATYAWLAANCPDIPIPCLRGFGVPNGESFTPLAQ